MHFKYISKVYFFDNAYCIAMHVKKSYDLIKHKHESIKYFNRCLSKDNS